MTPKKQKQPPAPAPVGRMMYGTPTYGDKRKHVSSLFHKKYHDEWTDAILPVLVLDLSDEARVVECMAKRLQRADHGRGFAVAVVPPLDHWRKVARAALALPAVSARGKEGEK